METDLYSPIKNYFSRQGYDVKSEVQGCDVTATKGDELIIIELKLHFNIKLLYQAMERQKLTPHVYVAIPRPLKTNSKEYKYNLEIAKRMGIGLILVALDSPVKHADIVIFPEETVKVTPSAARKRNRLVKEVAGRTGDYNLGGSSKMKINTAFRERALHIACVLERMGPLKASVLTKEYGCATDTYNIMYKNHYGWFDKMGKGEFALRKEGLDYLNQNGNDEVVCYYRKEVRNKIMKGYEL